MSNEYNQQYREMAVKMALASNNRAAVARELGVPYPKLRMWIDSYRKRLNREETKQVNRTLMKELDEKDKRIAELEIENDILKKAAAYFVKDR